MRTKRPPFSAPYRDQHLVSLLRAAWNRGDLDECEACGHSVRHHKWAPGCLGCARSRRPDGTLEESRYCDGETVRKRYTSVSEGRWMGPSDRRVRTPESLLADGVA